jgi:hypothetical protein
LFGFDTAVINGTVKAIYTAFNSSDWGVGLSVSIAAAISISFVIFMVRETKGKELENM